MKNKKNALILLIIISIAIVGGYFILNNDNEANHQDDLMTASLRLGWIPTASFSGEFVGQEMFDYKYNLELECIPGGPGLNSIQLVVSGENEFGNIDASEVIAANEKGADLVIIAVTNYYSPGAFVSKKEKGITSPKDFENKKVGLLPFGSTTMLYENMLSVNNVEKSKVTEIIISPDLKSFINDDYDVHPVFVYDETVTLDMQNIEYNVIEPKDFGVKVKGPVYFCKRSLLDEKPELVEAFIKTTADGWNYALKNKEEAINILKQQANEIDTKRERMVLEKLVPYFSGYNNQPLNSDMKSWEETINILRKSKKIEKKVDLNKLLHLDFINEYYTKE